VLSSGEIATDSTSLLLASFVYTLIHECILVLYLSKILANSKRQRSGCEFGMGNTPYIHWKGSTSESFIPTEPVTLGCLDCSKRVRTIRMFE
jgi:hypothetical protein